MLILLVPGLHVQKRRPGLSLRTGRRWRAAGTPAASLPSLSFHPPKPARAGSTLPSLAAPPRRGPGGVRLRRTHSEVRRKGKSLGGAPEEGASPAHGCSPGSELAGPGGVGGAAAAAAGQVGRAWLPTPAAQQTQPAPPCLLASC